MIEDKLTHDERIRLECVAQAVAYTQSQIGDTTSKGVVLIAAVFEFYVKGMQVIETKVEKTPTDFPTTYPIPT